MVLALGQLQNLADVVEALDQGPAQGKRLRLEALPALGRGGPGAAQPCLSRAGGSFSPHRLGNRAI